MLSHRRGDRRRRVAFPGLHNTGRCQASRADGHSDTTSMSIQSWLRAPRVGSCAYLPFCNRQPGSRAERRRWNRLVSPYRTFHSRIRWCLDASPYRHRHRPPKREGVEAVVLPKIVECASEGYVGSGHHAPHVSHDRTCGRETCLACSMVVWKLRATLGAMTSGMSMNGTDRWWAIYLREGYV